MPSSSQENTESQEETSSPGLLRNLLKHMMLHFSAHGACIALHDESIGRMRLQVHIRLRNYSSLSTVATIIPPRRRMSVQLESDPVVPAISASVRARRALLPNEEVDNISVQQSELFAPGSTYRFGADMIGYVWRKNEAYVMNHVEYLALCFGGHPLPFSADLIPTSYLVVPIQENTSLQEMIDVEEGHEYKKPSQVIAVVVLYQLTPGPGFLQSQRTEAIQYAERLTLYLQNERLKRSQQRSKEYLQLLQQVSAAFPSSVKLSKLVEQMYDFAISVVKFSSLLLTLYDRDTGKIYDVFAVRDGVRVIDLVENPVVSLRRERPMWWQVTQNEKRSLQFSPARDPEQREAYTELLQGAWGDQQHVESFLLLPMKMFNRVIGSLSLTSLSPGAYNEEKIQVLETMLQTVTVSIENAKLYERDRRLLKEAEQSKFELAEINSALLSISSVLNFTELLNNLVESVAKLVKADLCVFFQLSPSKEELVAMAIYAPTYISMEDDGSELPPMMPPRNRSEHDELIKMIRLQFKDTLMEQVVDTGTFCYLDQPKLEELAQKSGEGGAIFLRETHIRCMLMIPMFYQSELIGVLGVPTPQDSMIFKPKQVSKIMAISFQATSAIRNAQLFEQREEAYAELERMDKLKDEFLVTASHELRTPLSAISGYSSLLEKLGERATPEKVHRYASKIAGATQQLIEQVNNMTEAAKMGALDKKLDLQIAPVQLLAAAEVAANMLSVNVEQKLVVDVDPRLWVKADLTRVRQVISNLLENAAKYSPPDTTITISAEATTLSDISQTLPDEMVDHALMLEDEDLPMVLVRVVDQGEGILPEDKQRIFDKFFRAPRSLTTPVRGTGLGLYICRRYVEAMGGRLGLERSEPNEGSIFSFYLPRIESPVERGEQDSHDE